MTIDETIADFERVAETNEALLKLIQEKKIDLNEGLCRTHAEGNRQIAEWLRELKELRKITQNRVHPSCAECKYMKAEYSEQPCRNCCNNFRSMFERGKGR